MLLWLQVGYETVYSLGLGLLMHLEVDFLHKILLIVN